MDVTLYSIAKTDKTKIWKIKVETNSEYSTIKCSYGYLNGKLTDTITHIKEGKNLGKKNQTDHYQQALNDAKSKVDKKLKEGYSYESHTSPVMQNDRLQTFLPMLAQEYKKHMNKVVFPCFIQPKLDGYRMIFNPFTNKMTSRSGKEFSVLYTTELFEQLKSFNSQYILDGELYCHQNLKFEDYGVLRKKKFEKEDLQVLNKIEYHVYDIIDTNLDFYERAFILSKLAVPSKIKIVNTYVCKTKTDIEQFHKDIVSRGYEGSIIRNNNGKYRCKYRSYDLLKHKDFDDAEFEIVGFSSEKDTSGNDEDLVVWICQTDNGLRFNVQSKGTKQERQDIFKDASKYIGKKLWVKFFGLTNDGVPRFPKTMRDGVASIRSVMQ
jgi:ATP-dependent DNA ligase